jgi:hypothetical protein
MTLGEVVHDAVVALGGWLIGGKHSGPYLDWRQDAMGRARLTASRSSGCRPGVSC